MKKEDSVLKARQTKLSKKTNEELINIILKKDNVEKNLANQITRLKAEVSAYQDVNKNLRADIKGTEETLNASKVEINNLKEALDNARQNNENNICVIKSVTDKLHTAHVFICVLAVVCVLELLVYSLL